MVQVLGFRFWGLGFRGWGVRVRGWVLRVGGLKLGLKLSMLGFWVRDLAALPVGTMVSMFWGFVVSDGLGF